MCVCAHLAMMCSHSHGKPRSTTSWQSAAISRNQPQSAVVRQLNGGAVVVLQGGGVAGGAWGRSEGPCGGQGRGLWVIGGCSA